MSKVSSRKGNPPTETLIIIKLTDSKDEKVVLNQHDDADANKDFPTSISSIENEKQSCIAYL